MTGVQTCALPICVMLVNITLIYLVVVVIFLYFLLSPPLLTSSLFHLHNSPLHPSVLCHLPEQGRAVPGPPPNPSGVPRADPGGCGGGPWRNGGCPAPAHSPQTPRLQRGTAQEQTAAEPRGDGRARGPSWDGPPPPGSRALLASQCQPAPARPS